MTVIEEHTHEEYRCFGAPGCGKTTWTARQVERWADEVGADSIMVASFTRAAAAEIASRKLPLPPRAVGTLHSFAYHALDGRIEMAEKHVDDFNDSYPGYALSSDVDGDVEERVADSSGRTDGDRMLNDMEVLRARRVAPELWPGSVASFAAHWTEWKAGNDYFDFTDLIEMALHDVPRAPGNPTIGFFDEVQDFTPLELALVRRWALGMDRVVMAGDDDQCLYGFKGASPDAFLDPPVDDAHKRVLGQSYRLPLAVHAVATTWVDQLSRREPKAFAPRDAEGVVRFTDTASFMVPELLVGDIEAQLDAGRTVMVLATCSYMLDRVKSMLKRHAIPYHNPYRRKRGDWNPLAPGTAKRRMAIDRVFAYLRPEWTGDDAKQWVDVLEARGLLDRGAKTRLAGFDGARRARDQGFDELWLPELLGEVLRCAGSGDLDWLDRHLLASKRRPFDFPFAVARRRGVDVLRETPRVVLGTIHSVKGGEADVVYLAPDISIAAAQQFATGSLVVRDELIRQFYVGMTRAREELVLLNRATPMSLDPEAMMRGLVTQ